MKTAFIISAMTAALVASSCATPPGDDAPLVDPLGGRYSAPRDVLQVYKDAFDVAHEESTMFLLTMHPHYVGHRSRIVILRELIDYIRAKDGVWFATHREAAEYVKAQAHMDSADSE